MRTTIRLDPDLLTRLKQHALDNGTTVTATIRDAVVLHLARDVIVQRDAIPEFTTVRGRGIRDQQDVDAALRSLR